MGKSKYQSNDLTLLGVVILKKKVRADGHQVCLCCVDSRGTLWSIVHVTPEGHIDNAKSFCWGPDPKIKKLVQLHANREYHKWVRKLMEHNDDFDG